VGGIVFGGDVDGVEGLQEVLRAQEGVGERQVGGVDYGAEREGVFVEGARGGFVRVVGGLQA
jgi:hypothetical protein